MSLKARYSEQTISIFRTGFDEPLIMQHAYRDQRPYIHPIIAPDGVGCLTENAPEHHLWQHGLYVGLNKINGVGFWDEGLTGSPTDGTFHPAPLKAPVMSAQTAQWFVETEWRSPHGKPMMTEMQQWTFKDQGATYVMDMNWSFRAEMELVLAQYPYGGLFLRMPYRHEVGGIGLNSEGQMNGEAEAQRARWVTVSMPIQGRTDWAGMTIMDHPNNMEHPVPWRVDGQLGISPSRCIAGEWRLDKGQLAHFQHRVYVYCGMHDVEQIEACWNDFSWNRGRGEGTMI